MFLVLLAIRLDKIRNKYLTDHIFTLRPFSTPVDDPRPPTTHRTPKSASKIHQNPCTQPSHFQICLRRPQRLRSPSLTTIITTTTTTIALRSNRRRLKPHRKTAMQPSRTSIMPSSRSRRSIGTRPVRTALCTAHRRPPGLFTARLRRRAPCSAHLVKVRIFL